MNTKTYLLLGGNGEQKGLCVNNPAPPPPHTQQREFFLKAKDVSCNYRYHMLQSIIASLGNLPFWLVNNIFCDAALMRKQHLFMPKGNI